MAEFVGGGGHSSVAGSRVEMLRIFMQVSFLGSITINNYWPATNVEVFIAQMVKHCGANTEATG